MNKEDIQLRAIVKIRNLVLTAEQEWNQLQSKGRAIDIKTNEAIALIRPLVSGDEVTKWSETIQEYTRIIGLLKEGMMQTRTFISEKNAEKALEEWDKNQAHAQSIRNVIDQMKSMGDGVIHSEDGKTQWREIWHHVDDELKAIGELVDSSRVKLSLVKELTPDEVDELTDTILKNMPKNYSEAEAEKYKEEYLDAYEEIKVRASRKKNLWDKFLDILAGGKEQSAEEQVMMKRWLDGERV